MIRTQTDARLSLNDSAAPARADALAWLADMPLLSAQDLADLTGVGQTAARATLSHLVRAELIAPAAFDTPLFGRRNRFWLTGSGIEQVANHTGSPPDEMLRTHPVSAQWLRVLAARVDGLAAVYRLIAAVHAEVPIGEVRLYRRLPLDAAVRLEDGRTIAIVREGRFAPMSHLRRRIEWLGRIPGSRTLLVISPDATSARLWIQDLRRSPFKAFFVTESDLALGHENSTRRWTSEFDRNPWPLQRVLGLARPEIRPREDAPRRRDPPGGDIHCRSVAPGLRGTPAGISSGEKVLLERLADWPWMRITELASLAGVSQQIVTQRISALARLELVTRRRAVGAFRYSVSDQGLMVLAARDRVAIGQTLRRWSSAPDPGGRDGVRGSRTNQLLRDLAHTMNVHETVSRLAVELQIHGGNLILVAPAHRAVRRFRYQGRLGSANPDAYVEFIFGGRRVDVFIECERRSPRPLALRRKLEPYNDYFASRQAIEDTGNWPELWMIVADEIRKAQLIRIVALLKAELAQSRLPVRVVSASQIGGLPHWNPLGVGANS